VTFLRTDIEGSMRLTRALGPGWDAIEAAHHQILASAVAGQGGMIVRTEGDAVFAVFPEAGAAVRAAVDGQRGLAAHRWPSDAPVRVRMGLHTGEAHLAGDDYGGFDVSRAARIAAVGHGGQIILSGTTGALATSSLPPDVGLRDLGRHVLKDVPTPERLFQLDAPGLRTDFPPLRVSSAASGNLPERLTSFVGRAGDLAELLALLDRTRLLTLTGPGGIGKTSLGVELARSHAESMPDGAWFVALEAVADADQVGSVIARTLGLFDGTERPAAETLPSYLAERSLLLVIDNFEHVMAAAGEVAALVRSSPASRFIVTSRAPLRVSGEQEYPVRPLPVVEAGSGAPDAPASGDASTELFIERARAARPGWDPAPDASTIAEICSLLDGLPLGIELAAARMSVLPPGAIRDRLAGRLPLPGSGPRDAPARQRTLEGAIAWSHDLLTPVERSIMHDLAVFEGGFDVEQVARVVRPAEGSGTAPDVLDPLFALADQALVARDQHALGDVTHLASGGVRFTMLKTVQAFALGRLIEDDAEEVLRRRHAEVYADLAETAAVHLHTARQPPWLDRLAADLPNLRGALRWSIAAGETEIALRLVGALWRFWLVDGHLAEGVEWVEATFAMPGIAFTTPAGVRALAAAGSIQYWRADREGALHWYMEQERVAAEIDDRAGAADAAFNLASANFVASDIPRSMEYGRTARRLYEELGDAQGVNRVDWGMTNLTLITDGPRAAAEALERVYRRAEELGDAPYVRLAAGSLAWMSYAGGDTAAAGRWAVDAMLGNYGLRDLAGTSISLPVGAMLAFEAGHPADAATIMGSFESACERYGVRPPLALAQIISRADPLDRARAVLEPDDLEAALARGRRMTLGETLELITQLADGR
jgi:predicted ATPase/class 3 adenylate cyclase